MKYTLKYAPAIALMACSSATTPDAPRDAATELAPIDVRITDVSDVSDASDTPDTAPPSDVHVVCTGNLTDQCPPSAPGPCGDLSDGMPHLVSTMGLAHDFTLSCAGTATGIGPDGLIPLTLSVMSDVTINGTPTLGDAVVISLFRSTGCGNMPTELSCSNSSAQLGGVGVFRVRSLPPGVYYLAVATGQGRDATVQASITASSVRLPGDTCPGIPLTLDGPPVELSSRGFLADADYGTTCGYGRSFGYGWVDAVFTYTLTATRDVIIHGSATDEGAMQIDVSPACGSLARAVPGCTSGNPVTRRVRNQAPGTYYVVLDYRINNSIGRPLTVSAETADPTPPGPAASCPGLALSEGMTSGVDIDTLVPGTALRCLPRQQSSAQFSFVAPAAGRDVVVNVTGDSMRDSVGFQLRDACGGRDVDDCTGPLTRFRVLSAWHRYQALTPAATYSLQGSSTAASGRMTARYYSVPTTTTQAVTGNEVCDRAVTIGPNGGVFTGTTAGAFVLTAPSCAAPPSDCAGSRGVAYRLDLTERRRVIAIERSEDFDALLTIRRGDSCPGATITGACNDDFYGVDAQVEAVLDAGTYWVIPGGCGDGSVGRYSLDVMVVPP